MASHSGQQSWGDGLRVRLDGASALPTLDSVLHDVRVMLQTSGYLGIILIDLEPLSAVESECGAGAYNGLLSRVASELIASRGEMIRAGDLVCGVQDFGEQIAIFLEGARRAGPPGDEAIERIVDRLWHLLAPKVNELLKPIGRSARFRLGYSVVMPNSMIQIERLVYRGLEHARRMAEDYGRRLDTRARERLRDVIVQRQLHTVFQPIVQMDSPRVRAYEALIRGPAGTDLASPLTLFNLAHNADLVSELDRACAACTLRSARGLPEGTLLFANVVPSLVNDSGFRHWLLEQSQYLGPHRLVLEINEGVAIRNYEMLVDGLTELRNHGVLVAVDDLGAGYANLDHVIQLRPDFLKLDISLVRGIHTNEVKQALVSSMVAVGRAVDATVIAEGIEEQAEHQVLVELGVPWGQGYLFARPGPPFPTPALPLGAR